MHSTWQRKSPKKVKVSHRREDPRRYCGRLKHTRFGRERKARKIERASEIGIKMDGRFVVFKDI